MKSWVFFSGLCAVVVSLSASAAINSASQDVLRMAQNGVSEQVLESYVNRASSAYNLNADDILYLQQNGVPQSVISAMLAHDNTVAQGQAPYSPQYPQAQTPQTYDNSQVYNEATPPDQTYNQLPPPDQTAQVNPPDVSGYNGYNYGNQYSYATQPYAGQSTAVMQVAPEQAPPQVASFYTPLQQYGTWIFLEGYGWCWQPNVVRTDPRWQPYCDNGQWVYCSDGWYWQSGYPWGWAAFHYGRWMDASCGWVWFPDTVWAPSWVTWRDYGNYCGWAPLPPSNFYGYGQPGFHFGVNIGVGLTAGLFTFIHFGDIFHGDYHHHEISHSQVNQFYHRTRVINNVRVVNNYYARNPGVSRQTVERYTGPVHVAHVRTSSADPRTSRPGVVGTGAQTTVVRAARPPAPERTTHIVGHRLPANARSVPTTPIRNTTPRQNAPHNANAARNAPASTTAPRTTRNQANERLQNPRANETPRPNNQAVSEVPRPTHQPNEVRQPNQPPRISETPRPSNPRTGEVPAPKPRVSELPQPNANPHVSEVPHPSQTPHVTEVPHPNPRQAPPRATTSAPQVHHAFPNESQRAPVHEPAGARPPAVTPHERPVPTPHEQPIPTPHAERAPAPHVSAPPAHEAPHVSAPPPLQAPHVSAPPQHAAPQAHEVHAPPPSAGHGAPAHNPAPQGHGNRDHDH